MSFTDIIYHEDGNGQPYHKDATGKTSQLQSDSFLCYMINNVENIKYKIHKVEKLIHQSLKSSRSSMISGR